MQKKLLEILKCSKCGKSSFSLEEKELGSLEIEKGTLFCRNCNAPYQIEEGIVDFLVNPSQEVLCERDAMDEDEYITDEEGNKFRIEDKIIQKFKEKFLSLPEGDGTGFFTRGGSFQTIKEGSDRFYSTLNKLSLTGKEHVLEIGACFTYASSKFAQKGCKVVAIDISNYLKVSKVLINRSYFDRIFCDMHYMPFIDNIFDIVFGSAVLHHSKNLRDSFEEILRVLKPGGRIVLINESARGVFEKVHSSFTEMKEKGFQDTSYTLKEWKRAAQDAGFKRVAIDFLSQADDYITRHRNKGSEKTIKLKIVHFISEHRVIEKILLCLSVPFRMLFRPKSWKLIGYK